MSAFAQAVKTWADKTGETAEDIVVVTITDLSRRVMQRTPVGDPTTWNSKPPKGYTGGQAKGNWFASIGAPSDQIDMNIRARNASKPLNRDASIRGAAYGKVYYMVNNLPYIRRLEYEGWSGQAPQGMVRVVMVEFNQIVKKAIKRKFVR